jgi:hypothetical protein
LTVPGDKREASDPFPEATPEGVAFLISGANPLPLQRQNARREPVGFFPRLTRKCHLPAGALRCSIEGAYQAAEALTPFGREQARRGAANFASRSFPFQTRAATAQRERSSPEKSVGRAVSNLRTENVSPSDWFMNTVGISIFPESWIVVQKFGPHVALWHASFPSKPGDGLYWRGTYTGVPR